MFDGEVGVRHLHLNSDVQCDISAGGTGDKKCHQSALLRNTKNPVNEKRSTSYRGASPPGLTHLLGRQIYAKAAKSTAKTVKRTGLPAVLRRGLRSPARRQARFAVL